MRSFDELVQAAYQACKDEQFSAAVEHAEMAIKFEPQNMRARMILSHALDHLGQFGRAAEAIGGIVPGASSRPDLLHLQANLFLKAGRPEEALPLAESFAKQRPESDDGHSQLGVILLNLGRFEPALISFKRAARLNQTYPPHLFNVSLALIRLGRNEAAIVILRDLVARFPEFVQGHIALGEQLLQLEMFEEAAKAARTALLADPDCVGAHLLLARALTDGATGGAIGLVESEAESHIRTALSLNPSSTAAHGMLAFALHQAGRFDEAAVEFEHSIRLNPRQGNIYYGLAGCGKQAVRDEDLRLRLERVLESEDFEPLDQAYVHYSLGKILEDQKQFEPSMRHYDAANAIMFEVHDMSTAFDVEELEAYVSAAITTYTKAYFEDRRELGSPSERPVIVLGMMRSGTTLVEQILSSHPSVSGGGELTFWPKNALVIQQDKFPDLDGTQAADLAVRYLHLLQEIDASCDRVTDKMPQNTLNLGLIHAVFPQARIIHCRRHPVDTCLSIYTTPYGVSPDFAHRRSNIVQAYRQYLRLMKHWRETLTPDRFLEIDYENLVADRESISRQMIDFLGLRWDDSCLRHESNRRSVKTPSRWQVRQPIYQTSVARWKNFEPWLGEFAELLTHQ